MAFWYRWPSLLVEVLGGLMLTLICGLVLRDGWLTAVVSLAVSAFYEKFLDQNGWSWADVGQRALGQAVGVLVIWLAA